MVDLQNADFSKCAIRKLPPHRKNNTSFERDKEGMRFFFYLSRYDTLFFYADRVLRSRAK